MPGETRHSELVDQYSAAYRLLDGYDQGNLPDIAGQVPHTRLDHTKARAVIDELRRRYPDDALLGVERGDAFRDLLDGIGQAVAGEDVGPNAQRTAARLLYSVIKDRPFVDGNERCAAALFSYYVVANDAVGSQSGDKLISSNALVAITLMVAMSEPHEEEIVLRLVENMLAAKSEQHWD